MKYEELAKKRFFLGLRNFQVDEMQIIPSLEKCKRLSKAMRVTCWGIVIFLYTKRLRLVSICAICYGTSLSCILIKTFFIFK